MAAVGDGANGSILRRSSGHGTVGSTGSKTLYCAVKLLADTNNYGTFWQLESEEQANLYLFGVEDDGVTASGITDWGGNFTSGLADIGDGEWWHVAYTGNNITATFFISPDGENWTQESINQTPLIMALLDLFDSGRNEPFDGKIAHWREWDTQLTVEELKAEAKSVTAVRISNLTADWRLVGTVLATVLADGVGTAFTAPNGGITVDTDEPAAGPNEYEADATDNVTATDSAVGALAAVAGATDTVTASDSATGAVGGSVGASDSVAATDAVANLLAGVAAAIDNASATDAADGELPGSHSASATDNVEATDAASYVYTPAEPPATPYLNRGTRLRVTARINGHLVTGTYEEISNALQQYAKERASQAAVAQRSNRARRSRTRREAATLRQQIDIVDVAADTERIEASEAREAVFKALRAAFADEYAQSLVLLNSVAQSLQSRALAQQAARQAEEARMAAELAADDAEAIRIAEEFFAEELQG